MFSMQDPTYEDRKIPKNFLFLTLWNLLSIDILHPLT